MTKQRRSELVEEVNRIRQAGTDPANMARKRLLEICDELLQDQGTEHLLRACLMAREELCFGGDYEAAKRVINDTIAKAQGT